MKSDLYFWVSRQTLGFGVMIFLTTALIFSTGHQIVFWEDINQFFYRTGKVLFDFWGGMLVQIIFPIMLMLWAVYKKNKLGLSWGNFLAGVIFIDWGIQIGDIRVRLLSEYRQNVSDWAVIMQNLNLTYVNYNVGTGLIILGSALIAVALGLYGAAVWEKGKMAYHGNG
jgi:hypothetical protein